jgi:hypothetical protein
MVKIRGMDLPDSGWGPVAGFFKRGNEPQNAGKFVTPVGLLTFGEGLYKWSQSFRSLVSQSVSQPASQPASQPVSQPVSQLVSQLVS